MVSLTVGWEEMLLKQAFAPGYRFLMGLRRSDLRQARRHVTKN